MKALGRAFVAAMVMGTVVLGGVTRTAAAPAAGPSALRLPAGVNAVPAALPPAAAPSGALLLPLRPAPTQLPDLHGLPCLPVVGCDPISGLGTDAADAVARAVFDVFANYIAGGVKGVLDQVSQEMATTTEVNLDSSWFQDHVRVMRGLAVVILLPLMLVGLITAVIHRDPHQLLRAGLVYVPVAIVGGAAAIGLTAMAIKLTDGLTSAVTGDMAGSTAHALAALQDAVVNVSVAGAPGLGTVLPVVILLVLMAGALVIWAELLVRTSAIYVVVVFLPVAMSGLVWRTTLNWTRRMIEVLVALILSKFVIVVVIDLAAGMIVSGQGLGTILQGATLLLLAACAPFALLRLIPVAEAGVIGHLERMERRPIAMTTRATTGVARTVLGGIDGAAGAAAVGGNGGSTVGPLAGQTIEGGELNDVIPPAGWADGADRPRRTAALVAVGDSDATHSESGDKLVPASSVMAAATGAGDERARNAGGT